MQSRATDDNRLARLRPATRVWAVSAIHGEAERLKRLHDRLAVRLTDGDRLVYLGNYLGRGDAIAATVDELLDFRSRILGRPKAFACDVVFLRGAQEEMWQKLLQLQFAQSPGEVLAWMAREGVEATVKAYGGELQHGFAASRDGPLTITRWTTGLRNAMNAAPGHRNLLASLHHAALTAGETPLLFVHAGVDASRPLAEQGDEFWWSGRDVVALAAPFDRFARVIRGFDRQMRGLVEGRYGVSLDAGAGRGGLLLAAAFAPDVAVLEVLQA